MTIHRCVIKDAKGKVKKVYDPDFLKERSDMIFDLAAGFKDCYKVLARQCKICGRDFATRNRQQIYCHDAVCKATAKKQAGKIAVENRKRKRKEQRDAKNKEK